MCRARIFATFVMSILCTVVTCADVRFESTMCSAILDRMMLIGSTRTLAASTLGGGGGAISGAAGGARGSGRSGAGAAGWASRRAR